MKTKIAPLSVLLLLGIFLTTATTAKATGPQPDQGDKYDLGSANITLFKLFTIQPEKKSPSTRQNRAPKPVAHKVEPDKKDQLLSSPTVLDRMRR